MTLEGVSATDFVFTLCRYHAKYADLMAARTELAQIRKEKVALEGLSAMLKPLKPSTLRDNCFVKDSELMREVRKP